jgi:hypothetical protein
VGLIELGRSFPESPSTACLFEFRLIEETEMFCDQSLMRSPCSRAAVPAFRSSRGVRILFGDTFRAEHRSLVAPRKLIPGEIAGKAGP